MKRQLTWHVPQIRGDNDAQGGVYYAEADYVPVGVRVMARVAPGNENFQGDIRVDGVSIFDDGKLTLMKGETLEEYPGNYADASPSIAQGSVVSFHILSSGGAEDISCQLELDSEGEESE